MYVVRQSVGKPVLNQGTVIHKRLFRPLTSHDKNLSCTGVKNFLHEEPYGYKSIFNVYIDIDI